MARPKKEKIETIKVLPSDPVERKRLLEQVEYIVDCKMEQEKYADFIKSAYDNEKDRNYDPSMIKDYVTLLHQQRKMEEKARKKSELLLERASELDILTGRSLKDEE
jgi:hypothetical protein